MKNLEQTIFIIFILSIIGSFTDKTISNKVLKGNKIQLNHRSLINLERCVF